jgi:hypothetical protein
MGNQRFAHGVWLALSGTSPSSEDMTIALRSKFEVYIALEQSKHSYSKTHLQPKSDKASGPLLRPGAKPCFMNNGCESVMFILFMIITILMSIDFHQALGLFR